jgi:TctA family transporter
MSRKLLVALAVYVALALLTWFTLDASIPVGGHEVPLRAVTLAILGLFALRTLLHAQRERIEQGRNRGERIG